MKKKQIFVMFVLLSVFTVFLCCMTVLADFYSGGNHLRMYYEDVNTNTYVDVESDENKNILQEYGRVIVQYGSVKTSLDAFGGLPNGAGSFDLGTDWTKGKELTFVKITPPEGYELCFPLPYTVNVDNTMTGDVSLNTPIKKIGASVNIQNRSGDFWLNDNIRSTLKYTGTALKPEVYLCYHGFPLKEGDSYTVSYKLNMDVKKDSMGTLTVTATGIGAFSGSVSKTYSVSNETYVPSVKATANTAKVSSSTTIKTKKITGLKKKVTLKKGRSLKLKPVLSPKNSTQKITYKTANKKIATVSKKGVIKAKRRGTTKITVKSGKVKFIVKVKVK